MPTTTQTSVTFLLGLAVGFFARPAWDWFYESWLKSTLPETCDLYRLIETVFKDASRDYNNIDHISGRVLHKKLFPKAAQEAGIEIDGTAKTARLTPNQISELSSNLEQLILMYAYDPDCFDD